VSPKKRPEEPIKTHCELVFPYGPQFFISKLWPKLLLIFLCSTILSLILAYLFVVTFSLTVGLLCFFCSYSSSRHVCFKLVLTQYLFYKTNKMTTDISIDMINVFSLAILNKLHEEMQTPKVTIK
jgi:hypothetical protein